MNLWEWITCLTHPAVLVFNIFRKGSDSTQNSSRDGKTQRQHWLRRFTKVVPNDGVLQRVVCHGLCILPYTPLTSDNSESTASSSSQLERKRKTHRRELRYVQIPCNCRRKPIKELPFSPVVVDEINFGVFAQQDHELGTDPVAPHNNVNRSELLMRRILRNKSKEGSSNPHAENSCLLIQPIANNLQKIQSTVPLFNSKNKKNKKSEDLFFVFPISSVVVCYSCVKLSKPGEIHRYRENKFICNECVSTIENSGHSL